MINPVNLKFKMLFASEDCVNDADVHTPVEVLFEGESSFVDETQEEEVISEQEVEAEPEDEQEEESDSEADNEEEDAEVGDEEKDSDSEEIPDGMEEPAENEGDLDDRHPFRGENEVGEQVSSNSSTSVTHQPSDGIAFQAREDMLPIDEIYDETNRNSLYDDPFGVYAIRNHPVSALHVDDYLEKPELGSVITASELQQVANQVFDAFNLKRIPVRYTRMVPNAAYTSGFFSRSTFDDAILFNPDYVDACVQELGSTDIVISDLAHEIGHYITQMTIGSQDTHLSEKLGDLVAGFVCRKFNLDIDVARKWFQWFYDPEGHHGYPRSEERWDIQAAGYHYGGHATFEDLENDFENQQFIDLVEQFSSETSKALASVERVHVMDTGEQASKDILQALGLNKNQGRVLLVKAFQQLIKHL